MAGNLTLTTAGRNYWMQRHNLGNAATIDKVTFGQGTTTNLLGRTSLVTPFSPAVELGLNTSSVVNNRINLSILDDDNDAAYEATEVACWSGTVLMFYDTVSEGNLFQKVAGRPAGWTFNYFVVDSSLDTSAINFQGTTTPQATPTNSGTVRIPLWSNSWDDTNALDAVTPNAMKEYVSANRVDLATAAGELDGSKIAAETVGCRELEHNAAFGNPITQVSGSIVADTTDIKIVGINGTSRGTWITTTLSPNNQMPGLVVQNLSDGPQSDPRACVYTGGFWTNIRLHLSTAQQSERFSTGSIVYLDNLWQFTNAPTQHPVGRVLQAARASEGIYSCQLDFTNYFRDFSPSSAIPAGTVFPYAGQATVNIPNGYLLCDGGTASKSLYPNLWAALGDQYGTSTATHFSLPDLTRRVVVGQGGTGTDDLGNQVGNTGGAESLIVPLPNHRHGYAAPETYRVFLPSLGTIVGDRVREVTGTTDYTSAGTTSSRPSVSILQPSMVMRYIIKY